MANARLLSHALEATGWYRCVSEIHRPKGSHEYVKGEASKMLRSSSDSSADYNAGLPVVAFCLTDDFKKDYPHIKQVAVSNLMRAKQYIIPNYPLPPNEDKTEILRVVVRESMSRDLLDRLIGDICSVTESLMNSDTLDLSQWQPFPVSTEKQHASVGHTHNDRHKANRPMSHGKTHVCSVPFRAVANPSSRCAPQRLLVEKLVKMQHSENPVS